MASNQEVKIPLRYWVDNEQKSVVMAEASGDFVDVLFSFLTLPLGTIIRLESEGKFSGNQSLQQVEFGCIKNLYKSVKHLSTHVFWNEICKQMLVSPRNPLQDSCQRLKLKVDDTQPTKYFMCHSCSRGGVSDLLLSTFAGAKCHCKKLMKKEMELLAESKEEAAGDNGVFVEGDSMFLIFDDLSVIRSSPSDSVHPPIKHRHKYFSSMTEMSHNVGVEEIFSILKQAITSKSPLSDVFLSRESKPSYSFSPGTGPSLWKGSVEVKVIVSKSQNKILFAEADGDFVDFLFGFLTTPLGAILNLMKGKSTLGSIDNLYKSVKNLNPSWFIGSSKKSLLNPTVTPQFGCKSNPLINASQEDTTKYWHGTAVVKDNMGRIMISKRKDMLRDPAEMKLFDPRSSDGAREPAVGFMKRPSLFFVTDDLEVKPMTTTSSILFLQELNVQLDDLEEHFVEIRKSHEALNLLMTSLTSGEGALTRSLCCLLKKWKCERCIPFWGVLGWKEKRHTKKKEKMRKKAREVISDMMRKKEEIKI